MIRLDNTKDNVIKLGGHEINDIREISVEIETPSDARGIFREPTFAATITIVRDGSDTGCWELFEMATNEDGRKVLIDGTLAFTGDELAGANLYTFTLKRAFIASWTLECPAETDEPTTETVILRVGDLEFHDGSQGASFKLKNFN